MFSIAPPIRGMLRNASQALRPARQSHMVSLFRGSENRRSALAYRYFGVKVPLPPMGDSVTEGKLFEWVKKPGDAVKEDEVICTIESDKLQVEVRSPCNGVLSEVFAQEGDRVVVGEDLADVEQGSAPKETKKEEKKEAPASDSSSAKPATTEAATPPPKAAAPPKPAAPAPAGKTVSTEARERRVKPSELRKRVAQRLKASQNTAAMLTTFQEIDMTGLMEMRNKYKDDFEKKHAVKLGFMSAFVKASTIALQEYPSVNAFWMDDAIVYHDYVDISVAVSAPSGLVVPVLRDCQEMSFADVEKKIVELGTKAKKGQLTMDDMMGGTFTISNGGVFGSLFGTPIINPPQAAILGMHAIFKRPMAMPDGSIAVRPIMTVALTYDHRLIDGREAVSFLMMVKQLVEDPRRVLLEI